MEGDMNRKQSCRICGGTDFFKDAGYFYCETCQTQNEDVREEVLEMNVDANTRLRKIMIKKQQIKRHDDYVWIISTGIDQNWTTWELYNFVLIGLTDELIELGVSPGVKLTVLQLWATYLRKIEVAFISMTKKSVPRLSRRYNKKDAEIIYGKIRMNRRSRSGWNKSLNNTSNSTASGYQSDGSSTRTFHRSKKLMVKAEYDRYLQSQASSDNDALSAVSQSGYSSQSEGGRSSKGDNKINFNKHAKQETKKIKKLSKKIPVFERSKYKKTHITTQYRTGPQVITAMKLWAIIYLALRIHDEPIQLGDMLRYAKEGHLSYYRLDHLLPPEIKLSQSDVNFLSQNIEITHKSMRRIAANLAKFIGIEEIDCPDIFQLISRYCQELALPRGVLLYAQRLIALFPPAMTFNFKRSYIPNYEARAMAYIIVVLKVLFGLDGVTERAISKTAEHVNINCFTKKSEVYQTFLNMQNKEREKKLIRQMNINSPCIIVHGGAGHCKDFAAIEKITACKRAACNGYKKLMNGGSSIEAVETALWWLECDEFFNCGYGSVLNEIGQVEMDASIMDGNKFTCGSVAAVSNIEHPISLAKYVLQNLPNTIIVGESAKQLARCANINWLSQGNMIAPTAHRAYKLSEIENYAVAEYNNEDMEHVRLLQNSTGTVGCIAWNGYSIAAGSTTGGANKKLLGRVGDSPLLGCGTYADRNVGCSLTGYGESIIKLGMARRIAEDINNQGYNPRVALQINFDYMLSKFGENGGGIVLKRDGSWDAYFTFKRMPYAIVKNNMITFGIDLNEQKTEIYKNLDNAKFCECESLFSSKQGVLDKKLFSFCEWQRYIECRRNILVNVHFPIKLKYNPNVQTKSNIYFKFFKYINSKRDDGAVEITDYKHLLPRDLSNAMKQCIENLNQDNSQTLEQVDILAPSLTPFHSYLQQLLDDSTNKLPDILKTDFYIRKVGYMTNIQAFKKLALQCNINLEIKDSTAHFIDKFVPYFEPSKIANLSEFQEDVLVCDYSELNDKNIKTIENVVTYMDKKIPCYIRINDTKLQDFEDVQSLVRMTTNSKLNNQNDFVFRDVLPNGKLLISEESDSEPEDYDILHLKDVFANKTNVTNTDAYKKYDVTLTDYERESMFKQDLETIENFVKRKMHIFRDSKGKFMKAGQAQKLKNVRSSEKSKVANELNIDEIHNFTEFNSDVCAEMDVRNEVYNNILLLQDEQQSFNDRENNSKDSLPNLDDCFNLSDISILDDDSLDNKLDSNEETSPLNDSIDCVEQKSNSTIKFFRPFQDYWMYHCVFSRVKGKNFELLEKVLPRSFRWLLNECAHILEITMEDLYEEVCRIETFHSQILKSDNIHMDSQYDSTEYFTRFHRSLIVSKW